MLPAFRAARESPFQWVTHCTVLSRGLSRAVVAFLHRSVQPRHDRLLFSRLPASKTLTIRKCNRFLERSKARAYQIVLPFLPEGTSGFQPHSPLRPLSGWRSRQLGRACETKMKG